MNESGTIDKFVRDQLSQWPLAAANFRALKTVRTREMEIDGLKVLLQHNPDRIRSTAAKTDSSSVSKRKCFLCAENRPPEQKSLKFEGRKGRKYDILLNPYPIFPSHLVIASDSHTEQSIWQKYVDMMDFAHHYTGYTVFYNGPRCGASAPDHLHFQACPRNMMPLERDIDRLLDIIAQSHAESGVPRGEESVTVPESIAGDIEYLSSVQEAQVYHYKHFTKGVFVLRARTSKSMAKLFYRLLDCAPVPEGEKEPMFNLLVWYKGKDAAAERPAGNTHGLAPFEYRAIVLFRGSHRSHHYFSEGPDHLTLSPGCADMAGLFILPSAEDYSKLAPEMLKEVLSEVSVSGQAEEEIIWRLTRTQPTVQVGIMSAEEIIFEIISDGAGPQKVSFREGKIDYNGTLFDELYFDAATMSSLFAEPTFILHGVTIGVDFHWERRQTQTFAGSLKFIADAGKVVAINVVGVEDYLLSVISSEMKSSATLEFLKAHAVISRSWVMSQIGHRKDNSNAAENRYAGLSSGKEGISDISGDRESPSGNKGGSDTGEIRINRWYDREDHEKFDVCADDHCQRYQGLTMAAGENVRRAIDQTWGEVLVSEGEICDARFSKCCGGVTEKFSSCWEDRDMPYLQALPDTPGHDPSACPYCNTSDETILKQVLNDYDLETKDFYRWTARYKTGELAALFSRLSGYDIGGLQGLVTVERGASGIITKLRIEGSSLTLTVGKELIIRKFLSESHLKSSAFDVRFEGGEVVLDGRGWGHGVGLCQIGAAVMAYKGLSYRQILQHYYPGAEIGRLDR